MLRLLKLLPIFLAILLLTACAAAPVEEGGIAATTAPVAQFARAITEGTGLTVSQVIHDSVSCLHDYALSVRQMELVEKSRVVLTMTTRVTITTITMKTTPTSGWTPCGQPRWRRISASG